MLASLAMLALYVAAPAERPAAAAQPAAAILPEGHPTRVPLQMGARAFREGHYVEALRNLVLAEQATPSNEPRTLLRVQATLLGAQLAAHLYREGLATYERADRLAAQIGDHDLRGWLAINASAIYTMHAEFSPAQKVLQQALSVANPKQRSFTTLLVRSAQLQADQGDYVAATRTLQQVISQADQNRENNVLALAFEVYGHVLLREKKASASADAFAQAVRWCSIAHQPAPLSLLRGLAAARETEGDREAAEQYLTVAIAQQHERGTPLSPWLLRQSRAQVRLARNATAEALDDASRAMEAARHWRAGVLPSASLQTNAEVKLQDVYALVVEAGIRQYEKEPADELLALTLQAAEENRAVTLQQRFLQGADWESKLPAQYWETLAQYRKSSGLDAASVDRQRRWEAQLAECELKAGLQFPAVSSRNDSPAAFLSQVQHELAADALALSFHLTPERSYVWAIRRNSIQLHHLPGRKMIAAAVSSFRKSLEADAPGLRQEAAGLYRLLFGSLKAAEANAPRWILSADDALFELPFAALVRPDGAYLIERASIQIVPNLTAYAQAFATRRTGAFAALADPIFSTADPRFIPSKPGIRPARTLLLPRLPNTSREVAACARRWPSAEQPVLLSGSGATLENLRAAVAKQPAILHLSTHFITSTGREDKGLAALSLQANGEGAFLTVQEASTLPLPGALVVLSGCSSGAGKALPGAGWLGLTRSWLLAGARNVAASYWAVTDDEGALWQEFYERYAANSQNAADALRSAQLNMIHSGTWRATPRYWGAYFLTGRG